MLSDDSIWIGSLVLITVSGTGASLLLIFGVIVSLGVATLGSDEGTFRGECFCEEKVGDFFFLASELFYDGINLFLLLVFRIGLG